MIVQTIKVNDCTPQTIVIGRRGTYDTLQIAFDLSYLVESYGDGVAVLAVKRSQDTSAYPAVTSQADNILTWIVSDVDTYYVGSGECQLMWYVDGGLAKTIIYPMVVMRDILSTAEEAPDAYQTWVDDLTTLGAETLQNAQDAAQSASDAEAAKDDAVAAKEAAEAALEEFTTPTASATTLSAGSEATATYSDGNFAFGIPRGADGDPGAPGVTPDFSIGTVTTLEPTQPATATITGTAEAPVLNLGIPKGAKGDPGQGGGSVNSVNGKTGDVVLDAGDLEFDDSEEYPDGSLGAEVLQQKNAIDEITEETYNLVVGKLEGRTINPQGARVQNTVTDLWAAPVEQGKTYTVKTQDISGLVCGFFTAYPLDPNQGATTYNNSRTIQANNYTITAPIDGYIAFRSNAGYLDAQIVEGSVDKDYLPPVTAIDSVARADLPTNILKGKTLVCVGDSITSGDDIGSDGYTDNPNVTVYACNSSGDFSKQSTSIPMTYGYQIASRNNMVFYNGGVAGSTMQGLTDKNGFSLANGRYTKLPDNIDYLTIWFGWNDTEYGTLGTIADTTNATYYGAYNVVLPYLLNKYPYTKIGLIVPYGCDAEHRDAVRLLGNKWGVAVFDNYQAGTPLYYGKESYVGVDASVVTANQAKYQAVGAHPNYKGHTQLADMIEGWIKGSLCDSSTDVNELKNAIDAKQDATSYVTLSGTIVTQTGADNTMYLCGELAELTFTAPATGQTAIRFTSGTTPTVATFSGVTWLNGFDPTAIEASKTYEINILNGLGCAAWT